MNFNLTESLEILERTPQALEVFLTGLSENWLKNNEGEGTWNVHEVIEHLIESEKQNWIPRLEFILAKGESQPFPAFDRYAHLNPKAETTMKQKLLEFKTIRLQNIFRLKELITSEATLEKTGFHPAFGIVKVKELIATWAVHDLTHMTQILRVMAKRYGTDVGPWQAYLGILK